MSKLFQSAQIDSNGESSIIKGYLIKGLYTTLTLIYKITITHNSTAPGCSLVFSSESWWLIKQHKPNRKILVFYFALLTFQLWEVSHLCEPTWSTIVWGHPQRNILWKGHRLLHPSKINMDTKNDGLENVSPFKCGVILGIYSSNFDDESAKKVTYRSCPVGDAAMPRPACPTSLPAQYHVLHPAHSRSRPRCVVSWACIGATLQEWTKISWESQDTVILYWL